MRTALHGMPATLALLVFAITAPGAASEPSRDGRTIFADMIRGREILAATAGELGVDRPGSIRTLHFGVDGVVYNGLQGFDPADIDGAKEIGRTSLDVDLDLQAHRARRDLTQTLPGGIPLETVAYFSDGRATLSYPRGGHAAAAEPSSEAAQIAAVWRYEPALLVASALQQPDGAVYAGRIEEGGEPIDLIDLAANAAPRGRAHIGATDHRLRSVEAWTADPLMGDDVVVFRYEGERRVDGVIFPEKIHVERRGRPYIDLNLTAARVNEEMPSGLFAAPALAQLQGEGGVYPLGQGAYEIRGIDQGTFRVIFFDLGDGVAVFDAPESRECSRQVVEQIHRTLGAKPIKYLIQSHFHDDHVVGIGYYAEIGAKIVTVRANAPVLARYAAARSRLGSGAPPPAQPDFLFVDGPQLRLQGAGGRELVVYKLADCPHAKDMLVAYWAPERLLVEADLFNELTPKSDASAATLRWMNGPAAPAIEFVAGPHLRRTARAALPGAGGVSAQPPQP